MAKGGKQKIKLMLSSTVYGKEALLEQIYASLTTFGYDVWCSHKGTLPIIPGKSTFETCIEAVKRCDLFFCLISPQYGSGQDGKGGDAITHQELVKAIALDKPRFILAHDQVVTARRLLMDLGFEKPSDRKTLTLRKGAQIITDLRLIDMYEAASREELPVPDRTSNWVHKYRTDSDVLLFVEKQFGRYSELKKFVKNWKKVPSP